MTDPFPYKEVKGLTKGLAVLTALNRQAGGMSSVSEIARLCRIHRTTAKRLLETLRRNGLVRHGEREGQYCLTFEVRRLSEGFYDEQWVEQVARPVMRSTVPQLLWPCDMCTHEGGYMVVRESTHRLSTLSQQFGMIGERMPMFQTATGRAYFAYSPRSEQDALLQLMRSRGDPYDHYAHDHRFVARIVSSTLRRGYSVNHGEWDRHPQFSGIGVPVYCGERLLGAINMGFPNGALTTAQIRQRFLPVLRHIAEAIGDGSRAWVERG